MSCKLLLLIIPLLSTRSIAQPSPASRSSTAGAAEQRTVEAFNRARAGGALELHAFLERMPKGADLHMHLAGAIYAETFLKDAAEDGMCVDPHRLEFTKTKGPSCGNGSVPAVSVLKDQKLYDDLIDSFSMRGYVPAQGVTGHDQFFATFARFGGLDKRHVGEWLDEVASRAAAQNEQYLEIMQTPSFGGAIALSRQVGWPSASEIRTSADTSVGQEAGGASRTELAAMRDKLLAGGLRDEVAVDAKELTDALAARNQMEQCGEAAAMAACSVEIRFIYQVLRQNAPQQVFAQTLLGFEVASQDPDVVGINFVQPEDAYLAMTEYHRQMLMLDYLHSVYPRVNISLHAGELAPGMVPPAGLRFHIREAVDLGHAERIGHGVDVMYETDPELLLRELADRHVMTEINLTSNDVILGVSGNRHSLPAYLKAHVPVALSTDDEGVSRIDLTHEYARAVTDFSLGYLDLKRMARTSLEHSFLPGASLWAEQDLFTRVVPLCAGQVPGAVNPSSGCTEYLRANRRAAQQWELEHRIAVFEAK